MSPRLQITARNIELKDWIRDEITKKAEKLNEFYDKIIRCRVVVEAPHKHHREGVLYNIRIDMSVPGKELVIEREPNADFSAAVRDSFDAAYRQLEEYAEQQRGYGKRREAMAHARVSMINPEEGYGILTTPDGRDIYFSEHSLLNHDLKDLEIGAEVRFVEEAGDKGPQASSVVVTKGKETKVPVE
ncbi:MAG TPA: HPF/RaiA family ribosome-associated protein [Dissulfurispiraceae bacterium]